MNAYMLTFLLACVQLSFSTLTQFRTKPAQGMVPLKSVLSLTPSVNLIMTVPWIHALRLPHVGSPSLTLFSGELDSVQVDS